MNWLKPTVAVVIGLVAAAAGLSTIRHTRSTQRPLGPMTAIGEVQLLHGAVEVRLPKTITSEKAQLGGPVYSQEFITTQTGADAVLHFHSGPSVRLEPDSRVIAESDPAKPDGVILTLLNGDLNVLKTGPAGLLHVYHNGSELPVKTGPLRSLVILLPNSGKPSDSTVAQTAPAPAPAIVTATIPDETPPARSTPPKKLPPYVKPDARAKIADALPDAEITRQIRSQTSYFQRCYLTFISRTQTGANAPTAKGDVIVGFKIQLSGKVTDAHVVHSDFGDPVLQQCLTEVIERTPFRSFAGEPVTVQEFPIRLQ